VEARSIHSVLVANRGEIARRVFSTCRRMGIATVAVFSEPDAGAPFVAEADEAYALGGVTAAESYLRIEAIVEAASATGAGAVHPGYGFLAENAQFAQAVLDAGLVWIGPPPSVIAAMGSKTRARELMEHAGVPVLPGLRLNGREPADHLHAAAEEIGYPLLVKASAGGGGKGMRLVSGPDQLESAVGAARGEAGKAFGDDSVFLERFAERARHVEIQILGDEQGTVVSLGERDCSVQRRHQKVIEEAPSPAVDGELRHAIGAAAVTAGRELGYVGAGTVEFLLAGDRFYFLEVNTRLQVEHPVTELVTGLDLVEQQILIAEGRSLPSRIRQPAGHAVEARLYAEDPAHDFLPVSGTLTRFRITGEVRVDAGVESGSVIGPDYDPMIAKVIAGGATRAEAIRRLSDALRRAELHGITTNRDFLVRVLEHPGFAAGEADTGFLDRHRLAEPLLDEDDVRAAAAAAALALQAGRRASARTLGSQPSGWRNVPSLLQRGTFESAGGRLLRVEYGFDRASRLTRLEVDDAPLGSPLLRSCSSVSVDLEIDRRRRRFRIHVDRELVHVNTERGQITLRLCPRHPRGESDSAPPGSLTAPMPGAVLRVLTGVGNRVTTGEPLLVLEAMKMEHEIVSPTAGVVRELPVSEGTQVQAGAVLAVIDDQEDG
jgi:propionyl-CoA carboxylase alpha chain